jgi:hypothetical protein
LSGLERMNGRARGKAPDRFVSGDGLTRTTGAEELEPPTYGFGDPRGFGLAIRFGWPAGPCASPYAGPTTLQIRSGACETRRDPGLAQRLAHPPAGPRTLARVDSHPDGTFGGSRACRARGRSSSRVREGRTVGTRRAAGRERAPGKPEFGASLKQLPGSGMARRQEGWLLSRPSWESHDFPSSSSTLGAAQSGDDRPSAMTPSWTTARARKFSAASRRTSRRTRSTALRRSGSYGATNGADSSQRCRARRPFGETCLASGDFDAPVVLPGSCSGGNRAAAKRATASELNEHNSGVRPYSKKRRAA